MRKCIIDNCNKPHDSHGFCGMHNMRIKKYGTPDYTKWPRHNDDNSPEHITWTTAKQRCFNPNNQHYAEYGGRGIGMCDRWKNSYVNFLKDMGRRPTPKHQIDRINNDGNYEPSNCRWATKHEQMRNRRNTNNQVGVSAFKSGRNTYWEARLIVDKKDVLRKAFKSEQEAITARQQAEMLYLHNN